LLYGSGKQRGSVEGDGAIYLGEDAVRYNLRLVEIVASGPVSGSSDVSKRKHSAKVLL
jgi:hypothetical protein